LAFITFTAIGIEAARNVNTTVRNNFMVLVTQGGCQH